MAVYSFQKTQYIPSTLDKTWLFFADAANLPLITLPGMDFHIISSSHGDRIYAGQLIEYTLRPLPGFRVYWMTEITHVQAPAPASALALSSAPALSSASQTGEAYFVDEQRRGPYSLWHHQHHFKGVPGGIEMTDIVHYEVPFGWIGNLANSILVKSKLEDIFSYRTRRVEEIFGKFKG